MPGRLLRRSALFLLLAMAAGAEAAEVFTSVPPVARVTDLTGSLSPAAQAALTDQLQKFEERKGSQIAVLVVPTTAPETIEQYGLRVAEKWKLGRERVDDGVLVLVAKEDRSARIEVGYGLEGVLPDAIASRIVREDMAPYFKNGDYESGISAAVNQIIRVIDQENLPPPRKNRWIADERFFPSLYMILTIGGFILRRAIGRLPAAITGSVVTAAVLAAMSVPLPVLIFLVVLIFLMMLSRSGDVFSKSGHPRSGWGGGGFGGGGFRGGGGSFGGGGASGRW
ncbi:MAG: YgcG family protein [Kiritimatiellae bacterium]|nr:YgcG family protein [Kiritimatiellia bacterium]